MKISTTVRMLKETKSRIKQASRSSGYDCSELFILLIKRIMKDHTRFYRYNRGIQYQSREKKEKWSRLHVSIISRDYEYCLDMRKFSKRSVSLLCSIAVDLYLDQIIDELKNPRKKTDNYQFQHYILQHETIDDIDCWKIYWGIPISMNNYRHNTPSHR